MIDDLPSASGFDVAQTKADPDGIDAVLAEVRELRGAFDAKIRYDEGQEQVIAAMGAELDQHRQGVFQMQLRPVLLDLVAMHDDISQMLSASDCTPETAKWLGLIRDDILQMLARNGAEQVVSTDDTVDRSLHKVVKVVPTADPQADRRIAKRLRPGFVWNERVLRPEWVIAYRYEQPIAQTPGHAISVESRTGADAGREREEA
jgi:molecular chaperone GrpE (heat shock protein)